MNRTERLKRIVADTERDASVRFRSCPDMCGILMSYVGIDVPLRRPSWSTLNSLPSGCYESFPISCRSGLNRQVVSRSCCFPRTTGRGRSGRCVPPRCGPGHAEQAGESEKIPLTPVGHVCSSYAPERVAGPSVAPVCVREGWEGREGREGQRVRTGDRQQCCDLRRWGEPGSEEFTATAPMRTCSTCRGNHRPGSRSAAPPARAWRTDSPTASRRTETCRGRTLTGVSIFAQAGPLPHSGRSGLQHRCPHRPPMPREPSIIICFRRSRPR